MTATLKGISSMATRQVLGELARDWQERTARKAEIESVGGVDAAKRVAAGEAFDVVVLASDAIQKLEAAGHVLAGSRVDLVESGVAIAVRDSAKRIDVSTVEALKAAVLAAPTVGYSTGPSGVALIQLFQRWGIAQDLQGRLVQAPPGVPVGALVARGEVALGFQQLAELIHLQGITILGPMPTGVQIDTIFSGAVCASSTQGDAARELLTFMASPAADEAKRRNGMAPAA